MVDWLSPKENRRGVNEVGEAGGRRCIGGGQADQTALSNYPSTIHWREKGRAIIHLPFTGGRRVEVVRFPTPGKRLERYILFCLVLAV